MNPQSLRVAILGLARNCERQIGFLFDQVKSLRDAGHQVRVVVGEDNSIDGTRKLLDARQDIEVVDTEHKAAKSRYEKMGFARELVRRKYEAGERAEIVIVVDLDGPFVTKLTPEYLATVPIKLGSEGCIGISAYSNPYYDLIAFEDDDISFEGLAQRISQSKKNALAFYLLKRNLIFHHQRELAKRLPGRSLSAFNGIAIYESEKYLSGSYVSSETPTPNEDETWICEHLRFNRQVRRKFPGEFLIDKDLVVDAPSDHVSILLPATLKLLANFVQRLRRI